MTNLVTFLRARLWDDECLARTAIEGNGTGVWDEPFSGVLRLDGVEGIDGLHALGDSRLTRHIANWSPARVLAEVEAQRRILAEHEHRTDEWPPRYNEPTSAFGCTTCHWNDEYSRLTDGGWCPTLRLLALPFASHPDYDETWRPA